MSQPVEHGWRAVPLIYLRLVAPADVIERFASWRRHNDIPWFHECREGGMVFAGYFRAEYAEAITAWLEDNAEQTWTDTP